MSFDKAQIMIFVDDILHALQRLVISTQLISLSCLNVLLMIPLFILQDSHTQ